MASHSWKDFEDQKKKWICSYYLLTLLLFQTFVEHKRT